MFAFFHKVEVVQCGFLNAMFNAAMDQKKLVTSLRRLKLKDKKEGPRRKTDKKMRVLPTIWGQIKQLTQQATAMITSQGRQMTPEIIFVAIMAIITCQVSSMGGEVY